MKGFPHETPNPSYVTDYTVGILPIPIAPGAILATAPAIKGGDVAKKIELTILVSWDIVPESILFQCERDGGLLPEVYGYDNPNVGGVAPLQQTYTLHYVDETPGKGEPVYTIRGTSVAGAVGVALSRITVFNL